MQYNNFSSLLIGVGNGVFLVITLRLVLFLFSNNTHLNFNKQVIHLTICNVYPYLLYSCF